MVMRSLKANINKFLSSYFSEDVDISDKLCYIICLCGLVTNILSVISTLKIGSSPVCNIINYSSLIFVLACTIIAFATKKTKLITPIITILVGNVIIPLIYLTEGGQNGGMPFYLLLSAICIGFAIKQKFKHVIAIISIIEFAVLIYVNYTYPELIIPIQEDSIITDAIFSVIVCFLFIFVLACQFSNQCDHDKKRIEKLYNMYKNEANSDVLTGLYNRRYFNSLLETLIPAIGGFNSLHIAMFDIDNFKSINDTFGHPEGDKVLKGFADILKQESISGIVPSRVGGEEFILLIPYESQDDAIAFTEYIVDRVRNELKANDERQVTVSAGFQTYVKGIAIEDFLQAVDEKLYQAKTTGKNKVVC